MALWTEAVTPLELTTLARKTVEEKERERISLSKFLPNTFVNDIAVRLVAGQNGLVEAAEFRSYDAETPIGAVPGGKRVTVELPPLGQKVRVSEYDQLRIHGNTNTELVRNTIAQVTMNVSRAVADRMELMRGQVLTTGKATINENQFIAEADFGRDDDLNITPATKWSDSENANPIEDLQAAVEKYVELTGEEPGTLLLSKKALSALMRSAEIRKTVSTTTPGLVTADYVKTLLSSFGLPAVELYDRKVRRGGKLERVIDEKVALLLPEAGSNLGATFWGTTLEATDARYSIGEDDRPGIAVGAYKDEDPMAVWVRANAIGMPVLADANLTAALTVLD